MDSRDSPSRLGKLMRKLRGRKRKPDRTGAITDGEEVHEAHSLLPRIIADDGRDEGNNANGENVGRVYGPSPSAPSIPRNEKPDNNENTTVPYHAPGLLPDEGVEPSVVADKNESNPESTVLSPTTKLLLRTIRESSDVFSPLKSVAGYLYTILEKPERTTASERAIESLAPRMKGLAESLRASVPDGDIKEEPRRKILELKLEDIHQDLTLLFEQGMAAGFLANNENAQKIDDLIEDIREAMIEYQTSLQQDIYDKGSQLIGDADRALLNSMPRTSCAEHHSGNRPGCLRGTRKDVLWEIERWLAGGQKQRVFWLNGLAGTGKSAIAQTFAKTTFADGKLGASFFCSRDFEDRSNLHAIFPTLAFQLAYRYPLLRKELLQVLKIRSGVGRESLSSQMEKLIVGPLKSTGVPTLIIIDAVDECKDEEPASTVLSILSHYVNEIPHVKFFITGRPEPRIRAGFRLRSLLPITEVFKLHEVKPEAVDNDIELFFRTRLTDLAKDRSHWAVGEDWPSSSDIKILCKKAAGFFIYASTVVKFVVSMNEPPTRRLALITSLPQITAEEGTSGVDQLYIKVLEHAFRGIHSDADWFYSHVRSLLGIIFLIFNPLSIKGLSELLRHNINPLPIKGLPGLLGHNTSSMVYPLQSLLIVPDSTEDPVRTFHTSFPDFLTSPARCEDERFFVEPTMHHAEILLSCLNLMKARLTKNICGLDDHLVLSKVEGISTRRKHKIGDALEYACRFWTRHLLRIPGNSPRVTEVQKAIDVFFTTCLLYWAEVLVLTGNFGVGIYAMNDVERWCVSAGVACRWTNDSQRFLSENYDTICDSPSQIYHSALPLCPTSSWLRECYSAELAREVRVVKGLPAEWETCVYTVSFDGTPLALVCSGDLVAVGLWSGDIIVLDAITGGQAAVLSGHSDRVGSLAFSLDGTYLISGSNDGTINLSDVLTGGVIKTFRSHAYSVRSVSISPDCTIIASGYSDNTIRLWNARTGECDCVIDGHNGHVNAVSFSPTNPRLLISASDDHTVREWDNNGHQIGSAYEGDHVAFSWDGSRFVSWRDSVATVRDSHSGAIVTELQVSSSDFRCCCFSPDGRFVAGSANRTIYVWNITDPDPRPVEAFVGHTSVVTSLAFSSSLISTSGDNTVKFWRIGVSSTGQIVTDPALTPLPPASITSISLQTKDGIAISSDSVGMVQTWDLSTGLCTASFRTAVRGGRDVRLINGRLIIVCDGKDCGNEAVDEDGAGEIQIWDIEKGELLRAVDTSERIIIDLWISGDGAKVFCLGEGSIRAWSTWTGEYAGGVTFQGRLQPDSLTVGGTKVWVHFVRSPSQGWDFGVPGEPPVPLPNSSPNKPRLDITDDTEGQNTSGARIKDTATAHEFLQLSRRFAEPCAIQCDHRYLVAGYESGEVLILDFTHMLSVGIGSA